MITDKQLAELLNYKDGARHVRRQVNESIKSFIFGVDIKDLKRENDILTLTETVVSKDYAKQSIKQAENIYIFSQSGFLLYLKFAEGARAVR